ncbi:sialidase family protein [Acidovorax sp. RAC01]|uniref:sialidase family protein n=1 Tax=Acidovorax sp. RAC01 TaxID=1842533 RepID=UPI00083E8693|nr:sialidase family protein [Acidovorax sp. RAC01]AOG21971.1 putative glycosyl hydrolase BNR repeat-containing protein [Acidovorax sp. RAC01]AOG25162.1 putative glycosyl hydrolase BNR repeat-containing protein [Acidovorax sp. RAC01]
MLIFDDSKGTSDGKERDQLQAMIAVGSEYMTYRDSESTVQRSGEFVRIEKVREGEVPRLCTMHEPPDAFQVVDGAIRSLDDQEYAALPAGEKLAKRSALFLATADESGEELSFSGVPGFKLESRAPRFTSVLSGSEAHQRPRVQDADYATQAGKRRLFALGDGRALLVRELTKQNDDRWYMGLARGLPTYSRRRKRTARVELIPINPETGVAGAALMGFDIHSGLGFDPYEGATPSVLNEGRPWRSYITSTTAPSGLPLYADDNIFMATAGSMWGRIAIDGAAGDAGIQGDASDTYAVAEPAYAPKGTGSYLALVAVHPAPGDTYNPLSAGPYRLTCTRTLPEGGIAQTKINFPAIAGAPNHYYGVTGMELLRTSPTTVVLVAHVHAMQSGSPGSIPPSARSRLFFWSQDNGASWTYAQVSTTPPAFTTFPYSSLLVKNAQTLLVFTTYQSYSTAGSDTAGVQVHAVTPAGTSYVTTITGTTFSQGLALPRISGGKMEYDLPYIGLGYGGAVSVRGKPRQRLWMQFDPRWTTYNRTRMLESPSSRPMLMVSDDGGSTWTRKLLPSRWQHQTGFVVAVDDRTLMVPVFAPRTVDADGVFNPLRARIYKSTDGGDKWRATPWSFTLPRHAWADGQFLPGPQDGSPSQQPGADEYDIDEAIEDYNRGELFPLVALRDAQGRLSPINPARPWVADHKRKEPNDA